MGVSEGCAVRSPKPDRRGSIPRAPATNDTEEQALLRNSMVEFLTHNQDVAGSTPAKRLHGRSVRLPALFVCFFAPVGEPAKPPRFQRGDYGFETRREYKKARSYNGHYP